MTPQRRKLFDIANEYVLKYEAGELSYGQAEQGVSQVLKSIGFEGQKLDQAIDNVLGPEQSATSQNLQEMGQQLQHFKTNFIEGTADILEEGGRREPTEEEWAQMGSGGNASPYPKDAFTLGEQVYFPKRQDLASKSILGAFQNKGPVDPQLKAADKVLFGGAQKAPDPGKMGSPLEALKPVKDVVAPIYDNVVEDGLKPLMYDLGKDIRESNKEDMAQVPTPSTTGGAVVQSLGKSSPSMVGSIVTGLGAGGAARLGGKAASQVAGRVTGTGVGLLASPAQLAAETNKALEFHPVLRQAMTNLNDAEKASLLDSMKAVANKEVFNEKFLNEFQVLQATGAAPVGGILARILIDAGQEGIEEGFDDTVITGIVANMVVRNYLKSINSPLANDPTLTTNRTDWILQNPGQVAEGALLGSLAGAGTSTPITMAEVGIEKAQQNAAADAAAEQDAIANEALAELANENITDVTLTPGRLQGLLNNIKVVPKERHQELHDLPGTQRILKDLTVKAQTEQLSTEETQILRWAVKLEDDLKNGSPEAATSGESKSSDTKTSTETKEAPAQDLNTTESESVDSASILLSEATQGDLFQGFPPREGTPVPKLPPPGGMPIGPVPKPPPVETPTEASGIDSLYAVEQIENQLAEQGTTQKREPAELPARKVTEPTEVGLDGPLMGQPDGMKMGRSRQPLGEMNEDSLTTRVEDDEQQVFDAGLAESDRRLSEYDRAHGPVKIKGEERARSSVDSKVSKEDQEAAQQAFEVELSQQIPKAVEEVVNQTFEPSSLEGDSLSTMGLDQQNLEAEQKAYQRQLLLDQINRMQQSDDQKREYLKRLVKDRQERQRIEQDDTAANQEFMDAGAPRRPRSVSGMSVGSTRSVAFDGEQTTTAGNGLTVAPDTKRGAQEMRKRAMEVVVDTVRKHLPGVGKVHVVNTLEEAQQIPGAANFGDSVFDGVSYRNTQTGELEAILVTDVLEASNGDALKGLLKRGVEVIYHEDIGHNGLREMMGEEGFTKYAEEVYAARQDEIDSWYSDRYGADRVASDAKDLKAKEWLAQVFTEKGVQYSGLRDLVRATFGKANNDASIRRTYNKIYQGLKKGKRPKLKGAQGKADGRKEEEQTQAKPDQEQVQETTAPPEVQAATERANAIKDAQTKLESAKKKVTTAETAERKKFAQEMVKRAEKNLNEVYNKYDPEFADYQKEQERLAKEAEAKKQADAEAKEAAKAQREKEAAEKRAKAEAEKQAKANKDNNALKSEPPVEIISTQDVDDGVLFSKPVKPTAQQLQQFPSQLTANDILDGVEVPNLEGGSYVRNLGLKPVSAKVQNIDIADYLDRRSKRVHGTTAPLMETDAVYDAVAETMNEEINRQLNEDSSGIGWYDKALSDALGMYALKYPELKTDPGAANVFKSILAITSQGLTVHQNGAQTDDLYGEYKRTGRVPARASGDKKAAIIENLKLLQSLLDAYSPQDLNDLFNAPMTVRDINALRKLYGRGPVQELVDTVLVGSAVFGPKIGVFNGNLNGNFNLLTIDIWMNRTLSRYFGEIKAFNKSLDTKYRKQLNELWDKQTFEPSKTVKKRPKGDKLINRWAKETLNHYAAPVPTGKTKPDGRPETRSYHPSRKTDQSQNAKNLIENLFATNDAPTNANRRRARALVEKVHALRAKNGEMEINTADLQAVLWYYEKDLFQKLGGGSKSSEKADYVDAAESVIARGDDAEQLSGAQNIRARRSTPEPGELTTLRQKLAGNTRDAGGGSGTDGVRQGTIGGPSQSELSGQTDDGSTSGGSEVLFSEQDLSRRSQGDDGGGRETRGKYSPLEGSPSIKGPNGTRVQGPIPELVDVAEAYAAANGIDFKRQGEYVKVDEELAGRIADAYAQMKHSPNDPAVQEAYQDLIRQTRAQYEALADAGFEFTFYDGDTDPYDGAPWRAMKDLRFNKKMAVFGTYAGYGTEGITRGDLEDNPMLADTGLQWADQNGEMQPVTANDLFRAVHDAFGHGLEGAGFRAQGEENAWQAHSRLFTGPALGAITSETRGQNSWLNYGPYGENNRNASLFDTVFADQKTGLMPEWTWQEGKSPDMESDALFSKPKKKPVADAKEVAENQERLNLAQKAWRKVVKFFDSKHYMENRKDWEFLVQKMRGAQTRAIQMGKDMADVFHAASKLDPSYDQLLLDFFTTAGADPNMIPDVEIKIRKGPILINKVPGGGVTRNYGSLRDAAVKTKQQIFRNGQDLVRLGMLPQEVFDANADAYLPRVILRYLMDENGQVIRAGGDMKASDLGYLKRKTDIDKLLMKGIMGVVEDPAYLSARTLIQVGQDIPLMDLFRTVKELSTPERDPLTGDITKAAQQNWMLEGALIDINYANIINKVIADKGLDFTQEGLPAAVQQTQDRRVTPEFLRAEADRLQTRMKDVYGEDAQLGQLVDGVANEFNKIANAMRADVGNYKSQGYAKLPDSPRYGDLRGAWVAKEIYDQLVGSGDAFAGSVPVLRELVAGVDWTTAQFKAWAVAANPVAWGGNMASNTHQIHAAGVPMYMIPLYRAKAIKALFENYKGEPSDQFNRFRDEGLILSTFAANELDQVTIRLWPKILSSEKRMSELVKQQLSSPLDGANAWAMTKRIGTAIDNQYTIFKDYFGDRYQDLELMDKLTIAMYLEDNGASAAEAIWTANEYLFDYTDVPQWLRVARRNILGAPFLTWAYKAAPRLAKDLSTVKGAMRSGMYYMMVYGAFKALMEADLTDEEREAFYAAQPPGRKYRGPFVIPAKWLDDNGKPVALDLSMWFPHAMFVNALMTVMPDPIQEKWHGSEFNLIDAANDMGFFSHPLLDTIVELRTNRDTFTGRRIYNPDGDNVPGEVGSHIGNNLVPLNFWFEVAEQITGVNVVPWRDDSMIMDSKGRPKNTLTTTLSKLSGVRGYAFDGDDQYKYRGYDLKQQKKATGKYYDELIAQSDDPAERAELRRERAKAMKDWSDKIRNRPKAFKPEMIRD